MCVCVRERQRQIQTGMGENKKDGVKESFTQKPNLWMLKRKRPKKSVNECLRVCVCACVSLWLFPWLFTAQLHTGDCLEFTHRRLEKKIQNKNVT